MNQWWPAAELGELSVAGHAWDLLKEITIIFITSTIVWPRYITGREHSPTHQQKIKDLLTMALPIRTRPNLSLSQSLPSGSFHKPLTLLHQEGRQTENHNHRKLNTLITWATAFSNSMKLRAMPCRVTQTDRSWWRVLTKSGPLEKDMEIGRAHV